MTQWPLRGVKIGVVIETMFIAEEVGGYQKQFRDWGGNVVLISNLWDQDSMEFQCDPMGPGNDGPHAKKAARTDFRQVRLDEYGAILVAANYVSTRLRYFTSVDRDGHQIPITPSMVRQAPMSMFLDAAMRDKRLVKGFYCHALWGLTPTPEHLAGRHVICHEVIMSDVLNAGGRYTFSADGVIVDDDIVTGRNFDYHPTEPAKHLKIFNKYLESIRDAIVNRTCEKSLRH